MMAVEQSDGIEGRYRTLLQMVDGNLEKEALCKALNYIVVSGEGDDRCALIDHVANRKDLAEIIKISSAIINCDLDNKLRMLAYFSDKIEGDNQKRYMGYLGVVLDEEDVKTLESDHDIQALGPEYLSHADKVVLNGILNNKTFQLGGH